AGVVISRDRLRITVDHDGLVAVFAQREGRMAAAIIELDTLPDAVRSTTENDHLLALRGLRLVLFFVRRIHVWSEALEFGSARINPLVHRPKAVLAPCIAHPFFGAASVAVARN